MTLLEPWWLLLMLLPVVVYYWAPAYRTTRSAVRAPFFENLVTVNGGKVDSLSSIQKRKKIQKWSLLFAWILLAFCSSEPVLVGKPTTQQKTGRDLMIALDMSKSMNKIDFTVGDGKVVSRWDGLKSIVDEFASQRDGDRLGLVVFGSGAYLMVPFTDQIPAWLKVMNSMSTDIAGPATAIGDAIGLSIKAFEKSSVKEKVMILVTDGSDNASILPPIESAKVAKSRGIKIYTLAIGNIDQKKSEDKVDVKTLAQVSKITNGIAYIAQDENAVNNVLDAISNIEPSNYEVSLTPNYRYLYPYIITVLLVYYFFLWIYLFFDSRRRQL